MSMKRKTFVTANVGEGNASGLSVEKSKILSRNDEIL